MTEKNHQHVKTYTTSIFLYSQNESITELSLLLISDKELNKVYLQMAVFSRNNSSPSVFLCPIK